METQQFYNEIREQNYWRNWKMKQNIKIFVLIVMKIYRMILTEEQVFNKILILTRYLWSMPEEKTERQRV